MSPLTKDEISFLLDGLKGRIDSLEERTGAAAAFFLAADRSSPAVHAASDGFSRLRGILAEACVQYAYLLCFHPERYKGFPPEAYLERAVRYDPLVQLNDTISIPGATPQHITLKEETPYGERMRIAFLRQLDARRPNVFNA